MPRRPGGSNKAEIDKALHQCHDLLEDMLTAQDRFCVGRRFGNEANCRRGLRKFGEAHYAFLNAAYSAGDYAAQAFEREHLAELKTVLSEPNVRFHRALRDAMDHQARPEYTASFELEQALVLKVPATFPHPDLRVAMSRGMVEVENNPAVLGKGHVTYEAGNLHSEDAARLQHAVAELGLTQKPPVIYMAEKCHERLRSLMTTAAFGGWFRR